MILYETEYKIKGECFDGDIYHPIQFSRDMSGNNRVTLGLYDEEHQGYNPFHLYNLDINEVENYFQELTENDIINEESQKENLKYLDKLINETKIIFNSDLSNIKYIIKNLFEYINQLQYKLTYERNLINETEIYENIVGTLPVNDDTKLKLKTILEYIDEKAEPEQIGYMLSIDIFDAEKLLEEVLMENILKEVE